MESRTLLWNDLREWRSTFCGSHYSLRLKIHDFQISHVRTEILGEIGVAGVGVCFIFRFCGVFLVGWFLRALAVPVIGWVLFPLIFWLTIKKQKKTLHFTILEDFFQDNMTLSLNFPFKKIFNLALFMALLKVSRTIGALDIRKTRQWSLLYYISFYVLFSLHFSSCAIFFDVVIKDIMRSYFFTPYSLFPFLFHFPREGNSEVEVEKMVSVLEKIQAKFVSLINIIRCIYCIFKS